MIELGRVNAADDSQEKVDAGSHKKTEEEEESYAHFIKSQVDEIGNHNAVELLGDKLYSSLRSVIGLRYIILFGVTVSLSFLLLFLYFTYQNFVNAFIKNKFIALNTDAGNCTYVQKSNTQSIKLDSEGHWEGQSDFILSKSLYQFYFNNFKVSHDDWALYVQSVATDLRNLTDIMEQNDLSVNLLYWSSWYYFYESNNYTQALYPDCAPKYIMYCDETSGTVSNIDHDCPVTYSSNTYDLSTGLIGTYFNFDDFEAEVKCKNTLNIYDLGFSGTSSTISLTMDATTIMTALAVAYNINGDETYGYFDTIDAPIGPTLYHSYTYTAYRRFDAFYPEMVPMWCIERAEDYQKHCVVKLGSSYGIPFFHQRGNNLTFPERCNCSSATYVREYCDQFSLLFGMFTWNISANTAITSGYDDDFKYLIPVIEYLFEEGRTVKNASEASYTAAWVSYYGQQVSNPLFTDQTYRNEIYAFSNSTSFGPASLITYYVGSPTDATVSAAKYQLYNGSCSNSLYFDSDYYTSLEENVFATLVESYYQCTATWFTALNNAIGIATGTANNFSGNGLLLIAYTILLARYILGKLYGSAKTPAKVVEDDDEMDETVIGQVRRTRELKLQNIALREDMDALTNLCRELQHKLQVMEVQQRESDERMKKEIQKKLKAKNRQSVDKLPSADLKDATVAESEGVDPTPRTENDIFTSITSMFSFH